MKKVWIKNISTKKKDQIKQELQKGNFLPFYTKSGTSVFTSRVTPDFEKLWYKAEEMKEYLFYIKIGKRKMKKEIDLENGFKIVVEGNLSHALDYEHKLFEQVGSKMNSRGKAENTDVKISVVKK